MMTGDSTSSTVNIQSTTRLNFTEIVSSEYHRCLSFMARQKNNSSEFSSKSLIKKLNTKYYFILRWMALVPGKILIIMSIISKAMPKSSRIKNDAAFSIK